jgi:hypothetical protein
MIGVTLDALANAEDERGHHDDVIRFQHNALRYDYQAGSVSDIAHGYYNLGYYGIAPALVDSGGACRNLVHVMRPGDIR